MCCLPFSIVQEIVFYYQPRINTDVHGFLFGLVRVSSAAVFYGENIEMLLEDLFLSI